MGYTQLRSVADLADGVEPAVEDAAVSAANRWTDWAVGRARELTPVAKPPEGLPDARFAGSRGRPPGTARDSWRGDRARREGRSVTAGFYSNDTVMAYLNAGTRPHEIRPRADRRPATVLETRRPRRGGDDPGARLRFYVGGRVVYARLVHHPGTKGLFMVQRVAQEGVLVLRRLLKEELVSKLNEHGRAAA